MSERYRSRKPSRPGLELLELHRYASIAGRSLERGRNARKKEGAERF